MAPKRSSVRSTTRQRSCVAGDVGGGDEGIGRGGGAAQAFFIAGGEGEPGSGGGELAGAGGADAFGGSGNEHDFAVNSHGMWALEAAWSA